MSDHLVVLEEQRDHRRGWFHSLSLSLAVAPTPLAQIHRLHRDLHGEHMQSLQCLEYVLSEFVGQHCYCVIVSKRLD